MFTLIKKRVQYTVDEAISESAEYIIKKVGLTPASVFSMVMAEIARTGRIPVSEPYRVCRRPSFLRECPDEKSKIYP